VVGLLVIEETAGAVAAEEERQQLAPAGDAANFFLADFKRDPDLPHSDLALPGRDATADYLGEVAYLGASTCNAAGQAPTK